MREECASPRGMGMSSATPNFGWVWVFVWVDIVVRSIVVRLIGGVVAVVSNAKSKRFWEANVELMNSEK